MRIASRARGNCRQQQPPATLPAFDPAFVTVLTPMGNVGYGRAHNRAIAWSRGRTHYHVVMNTDVTYEPGTLETMIAFMDDTPAAGLAMPRVTYPDGRLQHLCRLLPHPLDVFGRGFFPSAKWTQARNRRYEFHDWGYDRVENFPFLSGCFMVLRRETLDDVGGFDERFFLYAEDLDLSRRIHSRANTVLVPHATAVHEYRTQDGFSLRRTLYRTMNLARYFNKWGWFRDRERDAMNRAALARVEAHAVANRVSG